MTMAMFAKYMEPEERDEWTDSLDQALNGSRQADQPAIDRLESMLAHAEQAGREWPELLYRQWRREGMRLALQQHAKSQSTVQVAYNGTVVSKSARRGVRVTGPTGEIGWQQKLFEQMTWDEFDQFREGNRIQIQSLEINEVMAQKIAALHILVPDSTGPQDACDRLGTTLDDVLSA